MKRKEFIGKFGLASVGAVAGNVFPKFLLAKYTDPTFKVNADLPSYNFFEATNYWNKKIDGPEIKIDKRGPGILYQHSDNGTYARITVENTLPYNVIEDVAPFVQVTDHYQICQDPRTYLFPILNGMAIQGRTYYPAPNNLLDGAAVDGQDHHLIIVDTQRRKLYELYQAHRLNDYQWECWGSAIFDMDSYQGRKPAGQSSDAAGLPILPGVLKYQELRPGSPPINHALRMTMGHTRNAAIYPAVNHSTTGELNKWLPVGARLRLKANVDIETKDPSKPKLPQHISKIITCLKEYGAIIADNGTNFALSGTYDHNWDKLNAGYETNGDSTFNLSNPYDVVNGDNPSIRGSDFELIDLNQSITF